MRKKLVFMLITLSIIVSMALVGCGNGKDQEEATQTPKSTATTAVEATPTKAPGSTDGGILGELADPDDLKSYRMQMIFSQVEGPTGPVDSTTDMAIVNDPAPKATHIITTTEGTEYVSEMITIGDTMWVKVEDNWMEYPNQQTEPVEEQSYDATDYIDNFDIDFINEETVNGMHCKHYNISGTFTVNDTTQKIDGEIWVADQSGLPKIAVKQIATWESTVDGELTTMEMEFNITDINEDIEISPPPADKIISFPTQ